METFVREAIARAAFEREGAEGGGRDFLEVGCNVLKGRRRVVC